MEYSQDAIAEVIKDWRSRGYIDTIVVDHGLLYALDHEEYFSVMMMNEDIRVNVYDELLSGSAWSIHALTLNETCKGILILGGEFYNPWELTSEIRNAFEMPLFS